MKSRRQCTLPAKTFISLPINDLSSQKLVQIADIQVWRPLSNRTDFFSCLTSFLYIIPYVGPRGLLTPSFPVTTPRNEIAIRHSVCLWASFLRVRSRVQSSVLSKSRKIWTAGALNCMYPGKASHRALASLYQCPYFRSVPW